MKRIIASAGLVALGTAGLQAENVAGLTPQQTSKPWSVSAILRGFYDDNYATQPSGPFKHGSFGFDVSPTLSWNMPHETTYIGLSYTYDLKYDFTRPGNKDDQTHDFSGKLDHRFSNRYSVNVEESFIYASEPELIDQNQATAIRSDANVIRNRAAVKFQGLITEVIGFEAGYQNYYYDYLDEGPGSRSATLDRFEHLLNLDARWQLREHTTVLAGYLLGISSFNSSESIYFPPSPIVTRADTSDSKSHSFYVGAEHNISKELALAGKVGVQFTDYDNPAQDTEVGPYADISGTYTYLPGSAVRFGFRHSRHATDAVGLNPNDPIVDQTLTTLYGEWSHKITAALTGGLQATYQHGVLNGGGDDVDNFLLVGLSLRYQFNPYWSAEGGYNWDHLESDSPFHPDFTRNRVYLGVRAAF